MLEFWVSFLTFEYIKYESGLAQARQNTALNIF